MACVACVEWVEWVEWVALAEASVIEVVELEIPGDVLSARSNEFGLPRDPPVEKLRIGRAFSPK